jgi:hypothetical protein
VLRGQRRHDGTLPEARGLRLRTIHSNWPGIGRGAGRNASFGGEFDA